MFRVAVIVAGALAWGISGGVAWASSQAVHAAGASQADTARAEAGFSDQQAKRSYALGLAIGDKSQASQVQLETSVLISGLQDGLAGDVDREQLKARSSYRVGAMLGHAVAGYPFEPDVDALLQGVRDSRNAQPRLSTKQYHQVLQALRGDMRHRWRQLARTNLQASRAFMANNRQRDGVHTTASGLQYKVLQSGDGMQPDGNDRVTVRYTGTLPDGTVFDSSSRHGQAATFQVSNVIPGWTEALQLMHVGAHYKLFVPPKLAYGRRGAGSRIGPNQALIFDVELLKVEPVPEDGSDQDGAS